jgi:hypothetical protein
MLFERFSRPPKESPIGTYRVDVISLPEECDWEKFLPIEIRYIFANSPEYKPKIKAILAKGKAIGKNFSQSHSSGSEIMSTRYVPIGDSLGGLEKRSNSICLIEK